MRLAAATLMGLGISLIAPAWGLATNIDFANCGEITTGGVTCPGDTSANALTYSNGGVTMGVQGFTTAGPGATNLYVKQGGTGETGLGITAEVDKEISSTYFLSLNTSGPGGVLSHGITSILLTLESVQAGEGFKVCAGEPSANTVPGATGTCQTVTGNGSNNGTVPITVTGFTASDPWVGITGAGTNDTPGISGDVLLSSASIVPEPASIALFGPGLLGVLLLRRRFSVGGRTR